MKLILCSLDNFADIDLGDCGDDYSGCDSALEIGYCYNSDNYDGRFAEYGLAPAAVAYTLLLRTRS